MPQFYVTPAPMADNVHPRRASSKHSQCLGYSKEHRRCRLEQEEGSKTCHIHRNYYSDWFRTHPGFYSINTLTQRQQNEYRFQLGKKHVILDEAYLAHMTLLMKNYFVFLVEVAGVNPLSNPRIFRDVIGETVDTAIFGIRPPFEATRNLLALLTTPVACEQAFEGILTRVSLHTSSPTLEINRPLFVRVIMELFEQTRD